MEKLEGEEIEASSLFDLTLIKVVLNLIIIKVIKGGCSSRFTILTKSVCINSFLLLPHELLEDH